MIHHTIEHKTRHSLIFDPRLYDSLNFGTLCLGIEYFSVLVVDEKKLYSKHFPKTLIVKAAALNFKGAFFNSILADTAEATLRCLF